MLGRWDGRFTCSFLDWDDSRATYMLTKPAAITIETYFSFFLRCTVPYSLHTHWSQQRLIFVSCHGNHPSLRESGGDSIFLPLQAISERVLVMVYTLSYIGDFNHGFSPPFSQINLFSSCLLSKYNMLSRQLETNGIIIESMAISHRLQLNFCHCYLGLSLLTWHWLH